MSLGSTVGDNSQLGRIIWGMLSGDSNIAGHGEITPAPKACPWIMAMTRTGIQNALILPEKGSGSQTVACSLKFVGISEIS